MLSETQFPQCQHTCRSQKHSFEEVSYSFILQGLDLSIARLLSQGYKVGIVGQLETAALKKAGENRGGLFKRGLEALYTAATSVPAEFFVSLTLSFLTRYVDDLDSADDVANYATGSAPALMCLVEQKQAKKGSHGVTIGMLSVTPSTGDIIYDYFDDGIMRSELETRLSHIRPCELLLSTSQMSQPTDSFIKHFSARG